MSSLREADYYTKFMTVAIEEAKLSLREGNKGFGAVLVKNGELIDRTHDTEVTDLDPTAHAEIKLIRAAFKNNGEKNLQGCILISSHEPCPMCTGAIVWAKVSEIVFGTSIEESKKQGRTMIDVRCEDIVSKAPWKIRVVSGILADRCSRLYDPSVRKLVEQFRAAGGPASYKLLGDELAKKRVQWFIENKNKILGELIGDDEIEKAYRLILTKIGIEEKEAPVIEKTSKRMIFHSMNPCPALDACDILGLDTRVVCKLHTEGATDTLIKQMNPNLRFSRNYARLRPNYDYCEEIIELE